MGLLDNCKELFGVNNLYSVLSVERNATENELKKAYKKASLIIHPDKVEASDRELATKKFQVLSQVYFILSDSEKRAIYDETGCVDEENDLQEGKDWSDYWRMLFPKLTMKDINDFMEKYKGSEEEKENLKKCYLEHEGDMNLICEYFLGYEFTEEDRYREILNEFIKKKEVPKFPKFVKESVAKKTARMKKFKKEAAEAEKLKEELNISLDSEQSLVNAIAKRSQSRESSFNNLIQNLESRYCKKETTGRKKKKL